MTDKTKYRNVSLSHSTHEVLSKLSRELIKPANINNSIPIGIKDFIIHLWDKPVKAEDTSFIL